MVSWAEASEVQAIDLARRFQDAGVAALVLSVNPTLSAEAVRQVLESTADQDPAGAVIWCDVDPCYVFHPMNAYDTDECRALLTNVFRTPQFNVQYRVGGYVDWLLAQDATIAYRYHRRQLQLVYRHRPYGKRFLLKDPTHTFFVDAILEVFPDGYSRDVTNDPGLEIMQPHDFARLDDKGDGQILRGQKQVRRR